MLFRSRALARDLDRDLARAFALGGAPATYLGRALSAAFTEVFSAPAAARVSPSPAGDMLAESFCSTSGVGPEDYVISPDLLAETVSSAISEAKTRLAGSDLPSAGWARLVTANLEALVKGIAARTQPVTPGTASAGRMMALGLAAETSDLSPDLSGMFRQIATAVTWLERRHNGTDPPREVIVLALD